MSGLWLGYRISFLKNKQKNQHSAAERRRQPSTVEKRKMNTLADSNYFHTKKYRVHEFSCTRNAAYITYPVVTVYAICEGLPRHLKTENLSFSDVFRRAVKIRNIDLKWVN